MLIVFSIVDFTPSGLYKSPFGRFIWFWESYGGSRVRGKKAIGIAIGISIGIAIGIAIGNSNRQQQ